MKADLSLLQDAASRLSGLLRYAEMVKSPVSASAEALDEDATFLGACGYTAGVSPLQDTTSSQLVNL